MFQEMHFAERPTIKPTQDNKFCISPNKTADFFTPHKRDFFKQVANGETTAFIWSAEPQPPVEELIARV